MLLDDKVKKKRLTWFGHVTRMEERRLISRAKGPYIHMKVKVHTLDIAPLRSESPPQKRSGMARVLKGFHSFICTPTRSIRNRNEPHQPLPSQL